MEKRNDLREGELELINKYTRRSLGEDEIYAFSLVLCDNEIDRDHERFSDDALYSLEKLFAGVTGITDHDPKSGNQTARIFSCSVQRVDGRLTSDGRPYVRLTARAYAPAAQCSSELITMIDSGIKKEVSVGCAVKKRICSVCGGSHDICGHIKGRSYDGKSCHVILDEPTDAYEWSFVAVPAQKAAGVTKNYKNGDDRMDIEKKLAQGGEQTFSAEEVSMLAEKLRMLSEKAADGDAYRKRLEADISKAAAVTLPELKRDTLSFITAKMSAVQLEELCTALTKKAADVMPLRPQLSPAVTGKRADNSQFKNI